MVDRSVTRKMCLSAYVELPIDVVIELLASADLDELLASVAQTALGGGFRSVELHAVAPERVTDHAAMLPVTWLTTDEHGATSQGSASMHLFVIQSGRYPMTELIITLTVDDDEASSVAARVHRALEVLADRMVELLAA